MSKIVRQARRIFVRKRSKLCKWLLLLLVIYAAVSYLPSVVQQLVFIDSRANASLTAPVAAAASPPLFTSKPLVIWSSNFHPTPIVDLMALLQPLGVRFINKDLSNKYCQHFNTCSAHDALRVINSDNILGLDAHGKLIPRFYKEYRNDTQMATVDAFLCCDPPSACEIFAAFRRSAIVVATTRYNIGRSSPTTRWNDWNRHLTELAAEPWNVVGANNRYDVEYIRYFTGIDPQLLPSTCDHVGAVAYTQSRPGYLLWMRPRDTRGFEQYFIGQMKDAGAESLGADVRLSRVRDLYPQYGFVDLAAHRGIVHLPYQVSIMAALEQYRMNIPLIFPSKELLIQWHLKRFVVHEKTESPPKGPAFVKKPLRRSNIPAHPSQRHLPDPNDDKSEKALGYWLQFADYYVLPHIIYFNSTQHLVELLRRTSTERLWTISRLMADYNRAARDDVLEKWKRNLLAIASHSERKPH